MNETLKQIRINTLSFSEKDMAEKLRMTVSDYKKIENNPMDMTLLMKVAQSVGKPIEFLLNMQKQELKFEINDAWSSIDELLDRVNAFFHNMPDVDDVEFKQEVNKLLSTLSKMARKPRVALVGRSDVGKSTLINTLIGNKTLPEEWTPTTSIIIFVKHISDKPSYISSNVIVFKSDENKELWDDTRLNDEAYTQSLSIASGNYSLLNDYGCRQGALYDNTDATTAVVFVESDILNNCDLLDLPGYGTKDRKEDDALLSKVKNVDILIYMSLANGFMRGDDITWLQCELPNLAPITLNNNLQPLSNLFIVASQAHTVSNGAMDVLQGILEKGAERFERTLSDNYWTLIGQDVTSETFRKRFFTYSTDQESLRTSFEKDLRKLLEAIPQLTKNSLLSLLKEKAEEHCEILDAKLCSFRETIAERNKKKEIIKKLEEKEPQRLLENGKRKEEIKALIKNYAKNSGDDFTTEYNRIITIDNIVKIIEDNNFSKKEEDMKLLSSKISNLLNDSNGSILTRYSELLKTKIDEYINEFENSTNISSVMTTTAGGLGFNFKASFAGGLAGMVAYGAMSLWAASLGNLGAYILVAKGVSLLASVGISVGGTAAATSAIAAIGGPITIMVGIAALLAIGAFLLFSGGWKKNIAKKIVKQYDDHHVLQSYTSNIKKYWDDTETAFIAATNRMEHDYEEYFTSLKKQVFDTEDSQITHDIEVKELEYGFYKEIIDKLKN